MCLPWNHKWKVIFSDTWEDYPFPTYRITEKRCTHCGKEIVRKYRV